MWTQGSNASESAALLGVDYEYSDRLFYGVIFKRKKEKRNRSPVQKGVLPWRRDCVSQRVWQELSGIPRLGQAAGKKRGGTYGGSRMEESECTQILIHLLRDECVCACVCGCACVCEREWGVGGGREREREREE